MRDGLWVFLHVLDLELQLVVVPRVVRVEKCNPLASGRPDAGVTRRTGPCIRLTDEGYAAVVRA